MTAAFSQAILISLVLASVVGLGVMLIFNRLVALGRRCDQATADIDVQVKQRFDLIPNLVETVKGYAQHERGTLEAVVKARAASQLATTPVAAAQAEAMLSSSLGRLMAVAERYPNLQTSSNFVQLQEELSDLENKIAAARRYLNNAITEYNTSCEQFPANIIGQLFAFGPKDAVVIGNLDRARMEPTPAIRF